MRIISGVLKGKTINFLKNATTRPLKDSVRENIFNVIRHSNQIKTKIENSNILDLYSGIGSFGIESLSRDAKKVTFIEKESKAATLLKANLINLSLINRSFVYQDTIENFLNYNLDEKFDIFFLDPPFNDKNYLLNLESIKKNKIFKNNHLVIVHREKKVQDNFEDLLDIIKVKNYGRSKIIFGEFN